MSSEGYAVHCIGHLTEGIWDNIVDLSNTWAMYPERRAEFGRRELQDLEDSFKLLKELMHEITRQRMEAA